jgi:hypothetical protein
MMIAGSGSGSIALTSGSGSGWAKNTWIRNTGYKIIYLSLKMRRRRRSYRN